MTARICLVSPGNLSTNPRIVKEADALQGAGYDVTAVACDYVTALRPFDDAIAAQAAWRAVRVQRPASERYANAAGKLVARLIDGAGVAIPAAVAASASGGPVAALRQAAVGVPADLYIAHYVAALPAAGAAAQRHGALLGFDAEDFHAGEGDGSPAETLRMKMVGAVEGAWLPRCKHLTAAAPLIGKAYVDRYGVPTPTTVLNVFPLRMAPPTAPPSPRQPNQALRAYWFSQTIGLDRGLQPFLQAMAATKIRVELDLRGRDPWGHGATLLAQARDLGIGDRVRLLPEAAPEEMARLAAAYDVGLSLETNVSQNRQICLTNKTFTYLLAGIPTVVSDTPAQSLLAPDLGPAAALVSLADPAGIAAALDRLVGRLDTAKTHATQLGRQRYNWEVEQVFLLRSVEDALARQEKRKH